MRVLTSDRLGRWTRGTGLVAVAAWAWAVLVPGGVLWTADLAAGLIGSAVVTAVLMRRRSIPPLAQAIASTAAEPLLVPSRSGRKSRAGLRSRGERKP